jgi:oligopeptide/dipeptide ABC transporter ATP-binding protein
LSQRVLEVKNLEVVYALSTRMVQAVSDLSFELLKGETLGIMGESGAGKSTVGWSIMRMIEPPHKVMGSIVTQGKDVLTMSEREIAEYRWKRVAMIFQTAMNSLDPVSNVRKSFVRLLLDKRICSSKSEALKTCSNLLEMVGLSESVGDMYPFELSGGMKQRVLIAMAIAANPEILIADEPTTALDTLTQFSIMNLMSDLRKQGKIGSMIFISHDLSVQAFMADRIMVMLKGKMVEFGTKKEVFETPKHPYTQFLMKSLKFQAEPIRLAERQKQSVGCPFAKFCAFAMNRCFVEFPKPTAISETHKVSCFLFGG